jgi:hypothetical protein
MSNHISLEARALQAQDNSATAAGKADREDEFEAEYKTMMVS